MCVLISVTWTAEPGYLAERPADKFAAGGYFARELRAFPRAGLGRASGFRKNRAQWPRMPPMVSIAAHA